MPLKPASGIRVETNGDIVSVTIQPSWILGRFSPAQLIDIDEDFPPKVPLVMEIKAVFNRDNCPEAYGPVATPAKWVTMPFEVMIKNKVIDRDLWEKLDLTVRLVQSFGGWLCGGWFSSLYLGKLPNDLDFYFSDGEKFLKAFNALSKAASSVKSTRNYGQDFTDVPKDINLNPGDWAVELDLNGLKVQLIKTFFEPTIQDNLDKFDINICQFGLERDQLTFNVNGFADLKAKVLNGHNYKITPEQAVKRLLKYQSRGFAIKPEALDLALEACRAKFKKEGLARADALEKELTQWKKMFIDNPGAFNYRSSEVVTGTSTTIDGYGVLKRITLRGKDYTEEIVYDSKGYVISRQKDFDPTDPPF